MHKVTEHELLHELVSLRQAEGFYTPDAVAQSPVARYLDPARFEAERSQLFARLPTIAAHVGELPEPGAFLRRTVGGRPLLLTRDADDRYHAFLNVCRHRGAELESAERGCKRRFSCPYHGWTWDNRGRFVGAPHLQQGFPGLEPPGLAALHTEVYGGWVWVAPEAFEPRQWADGLDRDLEALGERPLRVAAQESFVCEANWKTLVEGGIEAYHFAIAHRKTIGPYFCDNLSTYQRFGPHLRSVLARKSVDGLAVEQLEGESLKAHANLVYSLFPTNQLLVQSDHTVWIQMEPLRADRTALRLTTLVPREDARQEHWEKNHQITLKTLREDFVIGEGVQRGLASGANAHHTFGRFEGALQAFNDAVEAALAAD